jgi:hypothetical protein
MYGNQFPQPMQPQQPQFRPQFNPYTDIDARMARLEQLQQGPQFNQPQAQQVPQPQQAQTQPTNEFIEVASADEAWKYEDWRIMAGETLYFKNTTNDEIYSRRLDVSSLKNDNRVYKRVVEETLEDIVNERLDDTFKSDVLRELKDLRGMMENVANPASAATSAESKPTAARGRKTNAKSDNEPSDKQ